MIINKYFSIYFQKNKSFLINESDLYFQVPNENITNFENYIFDFINNKFGIELNSDNLRKILKIDEFGETDIYYLIEIDESGEEFKSLFFNDLINSNFYNIDLFLESFISKEFIHIKTL